MERYPGRINAHEERHGGKFQGRRDVTRPGVTLEGYIIVSFLLLSVYASTYFDGKQQISTNRGPFHSVHKISWRP